MKVTLVIFSHQLYNKTTKAWIKNFELSEQNLQVPYVLFNLEPTLPYIHIRVRARGIDHARNQTILFGEFLYDIESPEDLTKHPLAIVGWKNESVPGEYLRALNL